MRSNLVNCTLNDDRVIDTIEGSVLVEGIAAAMREVAAIAVSASESENSLI
jgi:hypothetical protein